MSLTKAQQDLVVESMALVPYLLKKRKFKIPPSEYEDYLQQGYLGLCEAAERFDETKGKFSTFASFRVLSRWSSYRESCNLVNPKRQLAHEFLEAEELSDSEMLSALCKKLNLSELQYIANLKPISLDEIVAATNGEYKLFESSSYDNTSEKLDLKLMNSDIDIYEHTKNLIRKILKRNSYISDESIEIYLDLIFHKINGTPIKTKEYEERYGKSKNAVYKNFNNCVRTILSSVSPEAEELRERLNSNTKPTKKKG